MKVLSLVFLALIATTFCDDEFPLEKDVIILTDSTFDKAVEKYEYLLVLFYAPWCGHCKKFHPEYEKAATVLRKENLYLAKVDATVEKKISRKIRNSRFPNSKTFY
jgi:thiol-disulfide isomerase/thioredoxin